MNLLAQLFFVSTDLITTDMENEITKWEWEQKDEGVERKKNVLLGEVRKEGENLKKCWYKVTE